MSNQLSVKNRRELTECERAKIIALSEDGQSVRKISKKLGYPKSTVQDTISRYKTKGGTNSAPRCGRPSLLDENAKNHLKEIVENKPRITANEIQKDFAESDLQISTKTIRTHLHDLGLYSRFAARKPLLTVSQLQNRLNWCIERRDWSIKEWNEIIWSDESRFCLFSDGPQRVWRENGKRFNLENLVPTVKHGGGGVMVWGCFCGTGLGPLVLVEGKLNRFGYIQILENNLLPWIHKKFNHRRYFFQQDNAPIHTAKDTKDWMSQKQVKVLSTWPAQSPDLNPIENLWGELQRRVRKRNLRHANKHELYLALKEEWETIPRKTYKKLIDSMPRRVHECIERCGGPTSY